MTEITRDLHIEIKSISAIHPYSGNPRTHNRKQRRIIAASIRRHGFVNPILVDENLEIIAGHGRLEAANLLGLDKVPVIVLRGLTDIQKRDLRITDNKSAEGSVWDLDLLASELEVITKLDLDFDLEDLGFETGELDILLGQDVEKKRTN